MKADYYDCYMCQYSYFNQYSYAYKLYCKHTQSLCPSKDNFKKVCKLSSKVNTELIIWDILNEVDIK